MLSVVSHQGNVREFYIVWRVVTLLSVLLTLPVQSVYVYVCYYTM